MKRFKGLKGMLILFFLAIMIVIFYFNLSNRPKSEEEENVTKTTVVQETLLRNLETDYPQTPKEVVKYFSQITQCFYNETYTDDELVALADKIRLLYDDELVSYKTEQDYLIDLKSDISIYKSNNYTISSYAPSASTDVEYFTEDGFEWARLYCVYTIKAGKNTKPIQEVFILRKDDKSHWRIYGWQKTDG